MQISMDKKYQTKEGRQVRIYAIDGAPPSRVHGAIKANDGEWSLCSWYPDGTYYRISPSTLDLVEVPLYRTPQMPEDFGKECEFSMNPQFEPKFTNSLRGHLLTAYRCWLAQNGTFYKYARIKNQIE